MSNPHGYRHHVFFCTNQRTDGKQCCQQYNAAEMREYAKQRCKTLGIHGAGQIRINSAGCLDCCNQGPAIVVYPEAIWYSWVDKEDIDEIIEQHLQQGKPVARLRLDKIV